MARLNAKVGSWELPHVHMWSERGATLRLPPVPLVHPTTRIATIGSCFAEELARAMSRLGLDGAMHPSGLFYDTRSIRQELERIAGRWPAYVAEPAWRVPDGFVHPFKDPKRAYATEAELRAWSDDLDARAATLFRGADLVVMTLGLIETWRHPTRGVTYRQIPHPAVFESLGAVPHRLTTVEMRDDLEVIVGIIRELTQAKIVLTVSPVPLHATVTPHDVRVANTESKSRIRAVVSEFCEAHSDVHYFPSYEMVTTAERSSDFMREDGRHVHRHAVDFILHEFLQAYAGPGVDVPAVDTAWLTAPTKTAARLEQTNPLRGLVEDLRDRASHRIKKAVAGRRVPAGDSPERRGPSK